MRLLQNELMFLRLRSNHCEGAGGDIRIRTFEFVALRNDLESFDCQRKSSVRNDTTMRRAARAFSEEARSLEARSQFEIVTAVGLGSGDSEGPRHGDDRVRLTSRNGKNRTPGVPRIIRRKENAPDLD